MVEECRITLGTPQLTSVEMSCEEYINGFNRRAEFEPMCKACPNWASRWGCPPFDEDVVQNLRRYDKVRLFCLSAPVTHWPQEAGVDEMTAAMQALRPSYERELLDFESAVGGAAALFTGKCYHCGALSCSRLEGKPCRHAGVVRPSLEAWGFDLGKTATEVFGRALEWYSAAGPKPRYLTLIGAVFY